MTFRLVLALRTCLVVGLALQGATAVGQHHFVDCVSGTGNSAIVIIEASSPASADGVPMRPGDEVAVFDADGICAGHLVWQEGGNQAITVWGEDPFSQAEGGLSEGEEMFYRVWSAELEAELGGEVGIVDVTYDSCDARPPICSPTGVYHSNALFYLDRIDAYAPTTGSASPPQRGDRDLAVYPNPFVDQATIEVVVPESGRVSVKLVDVLGRVATQLYAGWMEAGRTYRVAAETDTLAPGTYVVHVQGPRYSDARSVSHAL